MIYFILNESTFSVKVGFTASDPEKRMRDLQVGCDGKLTLLAWQDGDMELEAAMHKLLDPWRVSGEWFYPCANLWMLAKAAIGGNAYASGYVNGKEIEREFPSIPLREATVVP